MSAKYAVCYNHHHSQYGHEPQPDPTNLLFKILKNSIEKHFDSGHDFFDKIIDDVTRLYLMNKSSKWRMSIAQTIERDRVLLLCSFHLTDYDDYHVTTAWSIIPIQSLTLNDITW